MACTPPGGCRSADLLLPQSSVATRHNGRSAEAPCSPQGPWSKDAALKRAFALAGLFALTFVVAVPLYLRGLVPLDEGALVHVADRLAAGQVLYRDVATGVMPGAYYVLALLYRLLGPSLEVGRILQAIILGVSACLVQTLAARFAPPRTAWWTAAGFVAVEIFAYRYPSYSPLAIVFVLIAVSFFLDHIQRRKGLATVLASGLALGLSLLCKQNYASFVALALGVVLLRRLVATPSRSRALAVGIFVAAFVTPFASLLLVLESSGALEDFLRYTVFALVSETLPSFFKPYPLLDLRDPFFFRRDLFNYVPFPPLIDTLSIIGAQRTQWLSYALVGGAFLAPPAVLLAAVLVLMRDLMRHRLDEAELALVAASGALFIGVFPRSDFHHLALVVPLLLVVVAWLWARLAPSLAAPVRHGAFALAALLIVLSILPPFFPVFFELPERLDTPLSLPRAERILVSASEADRLHALVDWLEEHAAPRSPLLVVPNDPILYFLADRPNPSPYPLVLPGSFDEDHLISTLARVDVVIARDATYDSTPLDALFPRLAGTLRREFLPDLGFLRRISEPGTEPLQVLARRPAPAPPAPGLGLDRELATGRSRIMTFEGREIVPTEEEIRRGYARSWLQTPSLFLRPPSGWQKLVVELPLQVAAGRSRIELSLALRPTRLPSADGAWLETFLYWTAEDRLEKLGAEWMHPRMEDYWIGKPLAYEVQRPEAAPAILVLSTSSGPHLDEARDELILMDPRLVSAGEAARLGGTSLTLPDHASLGVAAFEDTRLFERGLAVFPEDPQILGHLGTLCARLGRREEARHALEAAIRLEPDDPRFHLALAELLLVGDEKQEALAAYEAVLALDPDHPRALAKSAELLAGNPSLLDEALRRGRRAARLYPHDASVRIALAWIHLSRGDPEAATEEFLRALALGGDAGPLLDSINRYAPRASLDIPGGTLTRGSGPLSEAAFRGRLEAAGSVPAVVAPGGELAIDLRMTNSTSENWPALGDPTGLYRVSLGYRWQPGGAAGNHTTVSEGRVLLAPDVAAGSVRTISLHLPIPEKPGSYRLEIDAIQEGVGWFGERGGEPWRHPLEVQ